jgi:2-phospho-L-lactate guanylyltransferase
MTLDRADVWAVVPIKRFAHAKSRLAPVLGPDERANLARAMGEDVLDTLSRCAGVLAGTVVVTSEGTAAAMARHYGATVVFEDADHGINAALRLALERVAADAEAGVVIVPSDIPQLSVPAVCDAVEAISSHSTLAIAAAHEDGGTNLLACRPAAALPLHFGPQSFLRHWRAAQQAGLTARTLHLPDLLLDIDRPEDLQAFRALQTNTRTHALLSFLMAERRLGAEAEPQCLAVSG